MPATWSRTPLLPSSVLVLALAALLAACGAGPGDGRGLPLDNLAPQRGGGSDGGTPELPGTVACSTSVAPHGNGCRCGCLSCPCTELKCVCGVECYGASPCLVTSTPDGKGTLSAEFGQACGSVACEPDGDVEIVCHLSSCSPPKPSCPVTPPPESSGETVIYPHTRDTLLVMNTATLLISTVGRFQTGEPAVELGPMLDIAIDERGRMVGFTGSGQFVEIDKSTARVRVLSSAVKGGASLSFVPKGTVDPDKEALVTQRGAEWLHVDPDTGAEIGPLGLVTDASGRALSSSGDLASVAGGKTWTTVCPGRCGAGNDALVEVDPATGRLLALTPLGVPSVWGLAHDKGTLYLFSNGGRVWTLDTESGRMIDITSWTGSYPFYGAASTTNAAGEIAPCGVLTK